MVRSRRRMAMLAVALTLLACLGAAASEPLSVTLVDESAQDPPVVITSASARVVDAGTRSPDHSFITDVAIQNATIKPVEALGIRWDLYNAAGSYIGRYAEDLQEESADAPVLLGGAVRHVTWNRNHTYTSAAKAVVRITFVSFQDGTHWRLRESGQTAEPARPKPAGPRPAQEGFCARQLVYSRGVRISAV